jgi:hypothetical protein
MAIPLRRILYKEELRYLFTCVMQLAYYIVLKELALS